MIQRLDRLGVRVPPGFATTVDAFHLFLEEARLVKRIDRLLESLDIDDVQELAKVGQEIRHAVEDAELPQPVVWAIEKAHARLDADRSVAVRSSATAEDTTDASFAGQQETFLNVLGFEQVLLAIKKVYASLFNDRAIAYRVHHGFDHKGVGISAGVQAMVRSDLAVSGVAFTIDTESGFPSVVFVTGSYGLGEAVVQGSVNPDEFYLYKPNLEVGRPAVISRTLGEKATKMIYGESPEVDRSVTTVETSEEERSRFVLTDGELEELGRQALVIENHYGRPMDIEWAKDGVDGKLYIVQARPETVKSRSNGKVMERYQLGHRGNVVTEGRAVGQKIATGAARLIESLDDMSQLGVGEVLVTDMTDPDWEPVMKRAAAIVTNRGGRTCHAAIIARELGIPAVVGCGDATETLLHGQAVTVSCAEGDTGYIYDGELDFSIERFSLDAMPELPLSIMMNVGNPERALQFASLPHKGVGLARLEFVINNIIGIHPRAILELPSLPEDLQQTILERTRGYANPATFYVEKLTEGIAMLGAAFFPERVIVRLSDFKSNEYAHLIGGSSYEPTEQNPMIGFRGASRYVSESFADCFALECRAVKRAREDFGLHNIEVMIPVRTHPRRGGPRRRRAAAARSRARKGRPEAHHDVRDPIERHPRGSVPRAFRRILHRVERPHPVHPGAGSGLRPRGGGFRRAKRSGQGPRPRRHPRVQGCGQVHRHLRAGAVGLPGVRRVAHGRGDRQSLAQPGHGRPDLARSREQGDGRMRRGTLALLAGGLGSRLRLWGLGGSDDHDRDDPAARTRRRSCPTRQRGIGSPSTPRGASRPTRTCSPGTRTSRPRRRHHRKAFASGTSERSPRTASSPWPSGVPRRR